MSTFSVWAPRAQRMELETAGQRRQMNAGHGGWWSLEVPEAGPGTDYAFCIDGGEPRPDPRSPWQPHGVLGPSRTLDHAAFRWTDTHWQSRPLSSAVIYELHVGTFTAEGTFESAISKLDYLADLGITHLELLPVNEFTGTRGWGYDGVDLFAPHHAYGGPEGLKQLVDAAHAKGLGVIIDVVYNHFGPEGCFLQQFGPYLTDKHQTAWGAAVNYDAQDCTEVRRFVVDNALMWLRDYHADGLRLDAVHAYMDESATHILEELSEAVGDLEANLGRHLFLIAESDLNNPRIVHHREVGGYGLDAQWSDDFHHALHVTLTGEQFGYLADFSGFQDLATALRQAFVYDGRHSRFRGRVHGRPAVGLSGHKFLAYLQNHDQIGNRATGQRIGHLVSPGRQMIGAALTLASPFVPMLYMGEEWAASSPFQYFCHMQDPELARAVCEGRRREFGAFGWDPEVPDPQAESTFAASKLKWDEMEHEPHAGVLAFYRRLIQLRRTNPDLGNGHMDRVQVRYDQDDGWLIVVRGAIGVLCNLSGHPRRLPLYPAQPPELLASSGPGVRVDGEHVELPPESVAVIGPAGR